MRIGGLQKLTLLDYPGFVACTVFLTGCNLRCPYCHNPGLVLIEKEHCPEISQKELLDFLNLRKGILDGVCISGGEPTIQGDLPRLIETIRSLGYKVKLDTNGTNPGMLRELFSASLLDYVAMDIKNCPDRYKETCGGFDIYHQAQESVDLIMNSGVDYEFRTTVCKPFHDEESMGEIGIWLKNAKKYFIQPFVDSGNLLSGGIQPFNHDELGKLRQAVLPYISNTIIRGE